MSISNHVPHCFPRTKSHSFPAASIPVLFTIFNDFSRYYRNRRRDRLLLSVPGDAGVVLHGFRLRTNAPIPTQCSSAFLRSLQFVPRGIEK